MLFTQRRPAPPLDKWIEYLWLCRSEPRPRALERVLPSGGSQLILNLAEDETRVYRDAGAQFRTARGSHELHCERSPGSVLTGISTRFQVIDTERTMEARPRSTGPRWPSTAGISIRPT